MHDGPARTINLLGAMVLGVHDELVAAVEEVTGREGAMASALAMAAQFEGLTVGALRRFVGLSHPATVRLVNLLESEGLARREVDRNDRRATAVVLTAHGRHEAGRILRARQLVLRRVLDDADPEGTAVAHLEPLLERMLSRLTTDPSRGYELCRLCDIAACPQSRCPVETAAREQGAEPTYGPTSPVDQV